MRSRARALILAVLLCAQLCVPVAAFGQAGAPARRITAGSSLPATCISSVVIRDIFYKSGSNAGLYVCTAANTWTLQSGLADVVGPASSTNNAVALFDGTTGKLLKNSTVTIASGTITIPQGSFISQSSVGTGNGLLLQARSGGWAIADTDAGNVWGLISVALLTNNRDYNLPDASGEFALTSSNVASATTLVAATKGTCTLDGGATATCTATVPSGCTATCTYKSASVANAIGCDVSGTTLTAVSSQTLDVGTVSWHCY